LHEGIEAPRQFTALENAELVKLAANAFLATKISFVNEMANVAERVGADIREVVRGIGLDPRIGTAFMRPGIGYGGSCFPKDVSALQLLSGTRGYEFNLLSATIEANNRQREFFFKKVANALANLRGRRIAVWGLAFKGGTDDVRESASLDLVQRFAAHGAEVVVYDPMAAENAKRHLPEQVVYAPTAIDACEGADALVVLTDWPEFRDVSFPTVKSLLLEPRVFDGRNHLADLGLERLGFQYVGVGLGRIDA